MKNIKKLPIILSILSLLTIFAPANADVKVVTSIKPIHSLASYLMDGVGKPDLIVDGYASPHGFALKPSHAKMLQEADIVFWVGEDLENFLEKPLGSIAKKAEKIELLEIKGLTKLKFRERNIFEEHDDHGHDDHAKKEDDHDDHDHDKEGHKEDDHDKEGHDEHGHDDDHKKEGHDEHGHEGHAHGEYDPHIWLDPMNAKVILSEMAEHLIENDPKNEAKYKANLKKAHKDLDIFPINSKYKSLPGSRVAPSGSMTPVATLVSFATALIMSGLNCGSENIQLTLSCSITSLISANCSAPGITSVFTVNAPRILIPNLSSKY